jgi:uncharacterized membrane protein YhdT
MVRKIHFWEIIIYVALLYILAYILGKMFGWIKSPELIDNSALFAAVVFAFGIYKWMETRFSKIEKEIVEIKTTCRERSKDLYKKR